MKAILAVLALLSFNCVLSMSQFSLFLTHRPPLPTGPRRANSQAYLKNVTQKLDHFDSEDTTTFTQFYYENTEFFNKTKKNVVFLQMGGENAINENYVLYGSWTKSAKKYGALLIQLEHRFYGNSQPFSDLSTEHLRYLTSDQALADAANFIKLINKEYELADDVKWIVYGGSYSGSLAAWMRLKHPDLVQGAVSSSAPLFAKVDFTEYYQVVVDDLNYVSEQCVDSLKSAMSQVEEILNNSTSNLTVTSLFNVCEPIEGLESDDVNVESFYNNIARAFSSIAQVNGMAATSLNDLCKIMTNESRGSEIMRLSEVLSLTNGDVNCIQNNYWSNVQYWQYIYAFTGDRQWMFQQCNEFGWFQPSAREDKVFGKGSSIDFLVRMCPDVFGAEFNRTYVEDNVDQTNAKYGGTDIDVTNVVFVHGSFDPFYPLGITESQNPDISAIFVEGTSHCADTLDTGYQPPQLIAAKQEIDRLVGVWLGVA
ncbi:putative serine protease K12H4.7 [Anoplophora glabripennis]|uniref:putative serine protease K12H4.7 n=1 Tax=Anoplophora glabripennis TaxID=217634 RepID=UPI000873D468|nr:putative serine protease K12H4.7 [Anoplophora glabripennis]